MSEQKETIITVKNLVKKFGDFKANDNLSFEVFKEKYLVFLVQTVQEKQQLLKSYAGFGRQLQVILR